MKYLMPLALLGLVLGMAAPEAHAAVDLGPQISADLGVGGNGYWRNVRTRVWVDGYYDRVWVDPIYQWRYRACGTRYRHCVRQGCWNRRWVGGHWTYRTERVWVNNGRRRGGCEPIGRRGFRRGGRRGGVVVGVRF